MSNTKNQHSAVFIIMGVCCTGKSTVGEQLAKAINGKFIDGDDLHPKANVIKMSQGHPLNDDDRAPWLERIRDSVFSIGMKNEVGVIVCSALKQIYRDKIREDNTNVVFLHLNTTKEIIAKRMQNRVGHFMPLSLLDSQFSALEVPSSQEPHTYPIDITGSIEEVVTSCLSISKMYLN